MLRLISKWTEPFLYAVCVLIELLAFVTNIEKWYSFVFALFTLMFVYFLLDWFGDN